MGGKTIEHKVTMAGYNTDIHPVTYNLIAIPESAAVGDYGEGYILSGKSPLDIAREDVPRGKDFCLDIQIYGPSSAQHPFSYAEHERYGQEVVKHAAQTNLEYDLAETVASRFRRTFSFAAVSVFLAGITVEAWWMLLFKRPEWALAGLSNVLPAKQAAKFNNFDWDSNPTRPGTNPYIQRAVDEAYDLNLLLKSHENPDETAPYYEIFNELRENAGNDYQRAKIMTLYAVDRADAFRAEKNNDMADAWDVVARSYFEFTKKLCARPWLFEKLPVTKGEVIGAYFTRASHFVTKPIKRWNIIPTRRIKDIKPNEGRYKDIQTCDDLINQAFPERTAEENKIALPKVNSLHLYLMAQRPVPDENGNLVERTPVLIPYLEPMDHRLKALRSDFSGMDAYSRAMAIVERGEPLEVKLFVGSKDDFETLLDPKTKNVQPWLAQRISQASYDTLLSQDIMLQGNCYGGVTGILTYIAKMPGVMGFLGRAFPILWASSNLPGFFGIVYSMMIDQNKSYIDLAVELHDKFKEIEGGIYSEYSNVDLKLVLDEVGVGTLNHIIMNDQESGYKEAMRVGREFGMPKPVWDYFHLSGQALDHTNMDKMKDTAVWFADLGDPFLKQELPKEVPE